MTDSRTPTSATTRIVSQGISPILEQQSDLAGNGLQNGVLRLGARHQLLDQAIAHAELLESFCHWVGLAINGGPSGFRGSYFCSWRALAAIRRGSGASSRCQVPPSRRNLPAMLTRSRAGQANGRRAVAATILRIEREDNRHAFLGEDVARPVCRVATIGFISAKR